MAGGQRSHVSEANKAEKEDYGQPAKYFEAKQPRTQTIR
jgi:hypothetical protein